MTATPTAGTDPGADLGADLELAGALRVEVNRLAYHLRVPATRSGVTPTRLAALGALANKPDGLRPGDLAGLMGVTPPTMTRLAEVLAEAGWVERQPDPQDHRAVRLVLTAEGTSMVAQVRGESTAMLAQDLATLSPADRLALERALPALRALSERRLAVNGQ